MVPWSRRRLLKSGAALTGLSLAGCVGMGEYECDTGRTVHEADVSLSPDASWPTYRYDAGNTGYNPNATVPDEVSVRWRYTACAEVESGAAINEGQAYVGDAVLNGDTGTARSGEWHGYHRTPTLTDGTRYVAAHELTAVDTTDGRVRWTFNPDGEAGGLSAPTVVDGTVYVSGNLDTPVLYAVDTADGNERWRVDVSERFDHAPAVVDGTVYAVDDGGGIHAINAASGDHRWQQTDGGDWRGPAVVSDGTVYVTSYSGGVRALDTADGSERWQHTMADTAGPVAVADGTVVAAGEPTAALSADDGTVLWETMLEERTAPATVADGTVVVGERALALSDGSERWRFRTRTVEFGDYSRSGIAVGPVLVDDFVFMATEASDLYALGEATADDTAAETTTG